MDFNLQDIFNWGFYGLGSIAIFKLLLPKAFSHVFGYIFGSFGNMKKAFHSEGGKLKAREKNIAIIENEAYFTEKARKKHDFVILLHTEIFELSKLVDKIKRLINPTESSTLALRKLYFQKYNLLNDLIDKCEHYLGEESSIKYVDLNEQSWEIYTHLHYYLLSSKFLNDMDSNPSGLTEQTKKDLTNRFLSERENNYLQLNNAIKEFIRLRKSIKSDRSI